jgi:hypothetical protein
MSTILLIPEAVKGGGRNRAQVHIQDMPPIINVGEASLGCAHSKRVSGP